jgi:hypothetical protein
MAVIIIKALEKVTTREKNGGRKLVEGTLSKEF